MNNIKEIKKAILSIKKNERTEIENGFMYCLGYQGLDYLTVKQFNDYHLTAQSPSVKMDDVNEYFDIYLTIDCDKIKQAHIKCGLIKEQNTSTENIEKLMTIEQYSKSFAYDYAQLFEEVTGFSFDEENIANALVGITHHQVKKLMKPLHIKYQKNLTEVGYPERTSAECNYSELQYKLYNILDVFEKIPNNDYLNYNGNPVQLEVFLNLLSEIANEPYWSFENMDFGNNSNPIKAIDYGIKDVINSLTNKDTENLMSDKKELRQYLTNFHAKWNIISQIQNLEVGDTIEFENTRVIEWSNNYYIERNCIHEIREWQGLPIQKVSDIKKINKRGNNEQEN